MTVPAPSRNPSGRVGARHGHRYLERLHAAGDDRVDDRAELARITQPDDGNDAELFDSFDRLLSIKQHLGHRIVPS